jgi:hypothetical protein
MAARILVLESDCALTSLLDAAFAGQHFELHVVQIGPGAIHDALQIQPEIVCVEASRDEATACRLIQDLRVYCLGIRFVFGIVDTAPSNRPPHLACFDAYVTRSTLQRMAQHPPRHFQANDAEHNYRLAAVDLAAAYPFTTAQDTKSSSRRPN